MHPRRVCGDMQARETAGKELDGERIDRGDAQLPGDAGGGFTRLGPRPCPHGRARCGLPSEDGACIGEGDIATVALQQLDVKFSFQITYLVLSEGCESRRRGSPAEAERLRHGYEVA